LIFEYTGTTLYRYGDSFGGIDGDKVLQGGILNLDNINSNGPILEMFVEARVGWVPSLENDKVSQFHGMPQ
jgi:hypothetical protein